jgi:peroxiredoxin
MLPLVRLFSASVLKRGKLTKKRLRLHLPFDLISDAELAFARALRLPTFRVETVELVKRLTLVVRDGVVTKVFYPVFPPGQNAAQVLAWIRSMTRRS